MIRRLPLSEPLQLECDSAFSAGDKILINISLNNLETARMDLEDSKQDLKDEMLAKTLDSLQNIKQLNEVVDLNEEIGRGAYGTVKKVSLYGTSCAAKDIHAILIEHADQKGLKAIKIKYLNECINCSKLLHPNIVQFLGIHYPSEDAQLPWLVMEKMDCNLTYFLANHSQGNVSVNAKLSIIHDVSLGLKYLHAQDFIHRDLSSNNILLTKHLTAKIADLGVAKLLDPDDPKTHTLAPGTLHFLPPEATCANPQYGKPVDVFSLGCIMIHLMTHDWPDTGTCDNATLSQVEKRKPYLDKIKEPTELKVLITSCLMDDPKSRPIIDTVVSEVERLKTTYLASSSHHHSDIGSLDFTGTYLLREPETERWARALRKQAKHCHGPKCAKLTSRLHEERKFQPSQHFIKVVQNMKFPGNVFTDGSHFLYYRDNKLFVLGDMKKRYKMMGHFVLVLDLQNDTIDCIDSEVSTFCPVKDDFFALELDAKLPETKFNVLDTSNCKWINTSIPPLLKQNTKFPVLLSYSNLLLVISGNHLQVLELNTKQWFGFKLQTSNAALKPALSTHYAILRDQLFLCYAETAELYCADMQQIITAVKAQSQQPNDLTVCLTRVLNPVNYIFVHEDVLVALYATQNYYSRHLNRAWFYSSQCDHWHNVITCDLCINGQWFMMENGKAAVAELSTKWSYVWRTWGITAKIHQVQLETE
ncbi:uncharacterized protein [Dysidea avara]|uniref:uncharacterized protein isoform X2 n=1 Tax=Dysidea avara TaxID=196820 RepID=UPI0033262A50